MSTINSNTHEASSHPTRIKSEIKNTNTDNSTFLNIDLGSLWGETHKSKKDAHNNAIALADKPMNSWTKNHTITHHKTISVFLKIIWLVIHFTGSVFCNAFNHFWGLSRWFL